MKKIKENKRFLFYFLIGSFLMLICSGYSSPLYPHYIGLDTSMFYTIAKGLLEGKIAYIDLFDHKGPVFFWLEAVGYFFGGRTGVFCFQCLLLIFDIILLDKISFLFRADRRIVFLPFFSMFFYMFQHGNLTEEFSTPLILAGIYLELKYLLSQNEKHSPLIAYFYGLLLGLLAFIRLNNAVVLCGLLLGIIVTLIFKKQWRNLLTNLFSGILGIATVSAPICYYYYRNNALYDMLYGTFLHNLVYAKNSTHDPILSASFPYYMLLLFTGVFAGAVFLIKWISEKNRAYLSLLFTTILTYSMLAYTNANLHYFMLGIPLFAIAAAVIGSNKSITEIRNTVEMLFCRKKSVKNQTNEIISVVLMIFTITYTLLSAYSACAPIYKTYLNRVAYNEYAQVQEGISVIPEDERSSVIAYCTLPHFYYHADIVPCYKYFTLQKWMTSEKVNTDLEFKKYLINEHPLWVITRTGNDDAAMSAILSRLYTCKWSDRTYSYYRYLD